MQLTREMKTGNLDVIVRGHVTVMIGLLNFYTGKNFKQSWKEASEIVSEIHGHGINHVRCICEWVFAFLR
jgi:hypothetical protein